MTSFFFKFPNDFSRKIEFPCYSIEYMLSAVKRQNKNLLNLLTRFIARVKILTTHNSQLTTHNSQLTTHN